MLSCQQCNEVMVRWSNLLRHTSARLTVEIGYLIHIPGVQSEQQYVAVDTSTIRVSVIRDIIDHILDYTTVHIHMLHTIVTVFTVTQKTVPMFGCFAKIDAA